MSLIRKEGDLKADIDGQRLDTAQRHEDGLVTNLDSKAYKRALRKLDLFLLPTVTFIYFLNFLDRK